MQKTIQIVSERKKDDVFGRVQQKMGELYKNREKAKERFTVAEFEKQMSGIYTTSVNQETLDECPMAYKSMEAITENIEPTVKILKIIKPVYNFKAGGD